MARCCPAVNHSVLADAPAADGGTAPPHLLDCNTTSDAWDWSLYEPWQLFQAAGLPTDTAVAHGPRFFPFAPPLSEGLTDPPRSPLTDVLDAKAVLVAPVAVNNAAGFATQPRAKVWRGV